MAKDDNRHDKRGRSKKDEAKARLEQLQIALVDAQIWTTEHKKKICILFEGRDAAGKDGAIKRLTEVLSVRQTRIVALPKPSDRERTQWWFQRYAGHLPAAGEWTLFNRSWYNRAGVERVMGFSTAEEQEVFIRDVSDFEAMIERSGIHLIKLWLDISREEQKKRLDARRSNPLKRLKVSDLDAVAQERWEDYSQARDDMLLRSHTDSTPWTCVLTDSKTQAREHIIRHVLKETGCPEFSVKVDAPDPAIVFDYGEAIAGRKQLNK